MRNIIKKFLNNNSRDGQSLVEIIIGLAIGAILIGASALAIASMLNANITTQKWKAATVLSQSLLDNVRAYGSVNWQNLYGLSKTSSTQYFLNASGTTYNVIQGQEGMLDNDVTNGLVGEWKFDEDAGTTSTLTYDATGNGDNGTLVGGPTRSTSTCKIANCLTFNGTSQRVTLGSVQTGVNVSVSAWINTTSTGERPIFSNRGSGLYFGILTGKIFVYYNTATPPDMYSTALINDNKLHHIVWTSNGSSSLIYIDGVVDNTISQTRGSYTGSAYIAFDSPNSEYFQGVIDDVRIYNRVLSADEVKQLYNANIFTRYFYVENTCRTNDASSSISGVASCAGGSADDPSTQKVSAISEWATLTGTNSLSLADYVTRWRNTIFQQNDWSGGASATGTYTNPTNLFSSSSNIDSTGKSLRIQGL